MLIGYFFKTKFVRIEKKRDFQSKRHYFLILLNGQSETIIKNKLYFTIDSTKTNCDILQLIGMA